MGTLSSNQHKSAVSRRARQNKSNANGSASDKSILSSHHSAASGDVLMDPADFRRKPQSMALTQRPPRSIQDQIHWLEESFLQTLALSSSGAVSEIAFGFNLSNFPGASSMAGLFDQYCLYAVAFRCYLENSTSSVPSQGVSYGRIHTAIDFDSTGALSAETAIERYSTCMSSELIVGKSYERFVKPCIASVTGSSNSSSNTGVATTRSWINSSSASVPHFGIRVLLVGNQTGTSPTLTISVTGVIGLRNSI
jgi:hypothetical protein